MEFLTDFADEAVIVPLAVMVAASLAALGWWRGAFAWTVSVGGVLSLMLFLKILFVACAGPLSSLGIHSPSGHTAAAAMAYGGAVVLFGRGRLPPWLLVLIPPAIALLIGISRLVLHAHVPSRWSWALPSAWRGWPCWCRSLVPGRPCAAGPWWQWPWWSC